MWKKEESQPDDNIRIRFSVSFQKRYCDRDGQWQNSESYFPDELPKLQLVAAKAYEYVALQESEVEKG